jgi:hypothetical protein
MGNQINQKSSKLDTSDLTYVSYHRLAADWLAIWL